MKLLLNFYLGSPLHAEGMQVGKQGLALDEHIARGSHETRALLFDELTGSQTPLIIQDKMDFHVHVSCCKNAAAFLIQGEEVWGEKARVCALCHEQN